MKFDVRRLTAADASAYQRLRLRMLTEHPEAFGSSAEEEGRLSLADFARRLGDGHEPCERIFFGAIDSTASLIGSAGVVFDQRAKQRHRAHVVAMYVAAEQRSLGCARQLLAGCIDAVRERGGIEVVLLKVTQGNGPARALYARSGFSSYGIEPKSIKIAGTDFATELMALTLDR